MSKGDAGKGDRPRPYNRKLYDENYERIFGKEGGKKPKNRDECIFRDKCKSYCGPNCLISQVLEATK